MAGFCLIFFIRTVPSVEGSHLIGSRSRTRPRRASPPVWNCTKPQDNVKSVYAVVFRRGNRIRRTHLTVKPKQRHHGTTGAMRKYKKDARPGACVSRVRPYAMISETTPEPTVLPPSRIAKRRPVSIAIGVISSTVMLTWSPGRHISTPSGRLMTPVTSVVLK